MKTFQLKIGKENIKIILENYPRLEFADPQELKNYKASTTGVHWSDLNEDISLEALKTGKQSKETAISFLRWLKQRL